MTVVMAVCRAGRMQGELEGGGSIKASDSCINSHATGKYALPYSCCGFSEDY